MKVLAVVEEEPRKEGEDQFEFHCIRALNCGQEELDTGEKLCPECKSIYKLLKDRMEGSGWCLELLPMLCFISRTTRVGWYAPGQKWNGLFRALLCET